MKPFNPSRPRGIVAVRANAGGEVATVLAGLNRGFADFKQRQDQRLEGLDRRLDDIEVTLARPGNGQHRERSLDVQAAADFLSEARRRPVEPGEVDLEAVEAYGRAFNYWARFGFTGPKGPEIQASMSVGSDPDGGYWAPPQMANTIRRRLFETSPMRQIANVMPIGAGSIELPLDTNDATSGGWVGETESRPETATPQVGLQEIFAREHYAMPKVTRKLLDDGRFDIETWLTGKITDKLVREENEAFVTGAGVVKPRGFLDYSGDATTGDDASRNWGVLQYVPTGAAGAFPTASGSTASDPDALIDLQMKLKPEYLPGAVWAMRRSTGAVVRKLKDADGRYIWADSLASGQPPLLLGHPVTFLEDMPAIASDSFSIAFGNFDRAYQIVDRFGVRVLRDPFTTKGWVKFYTTKRVGGDVTDFDAIKLLKFSAS